MSEEPHQARIVVADDDEDVRRFVEFNLEADGYEVSSARDGEDALARVVDELPDLLITDVTMPKIDGFELVKRIRADARTRGVSIIMLTSRALPADRVVGLTAGADDYIIKPFDPNELLARVKSTLRRNREMREMNPLTQLAGNVGIQEELALRIEVGEPFALMYVDLDNFKSYNDYYGFLRGDEVLKLLAKTLNSAVCLEDRKSAFVGHIGGDDFVAIVDPADAEPAARALIEAWDREIAGFYDREDAERGYIMVKDRRDQMNFFPLVTVTVGIASTERRPLSSHWEAAEIASEMKKYAKREPRSSYAIDRRRELADRSEAETAASRRDAGPA